MLVTDFLDQMSQIRLSELDPACLRDVLDVKIHGETALQRLESFTAQTGNPYCFRVGRTPVRISFQPDGEPLEKKLKAYFSRLKTG